MRAPAPLCATLEVALNRVLRAEPAALVCCERMSGRSLALEPRDLGWHFLIELQATGVRVDSGTDTKADVTVRAATPQLVALALYPARGALPGGLEVEGDTALLQQFADALAMAGFDPEEWLAAWVGDVVAHHATQAAHGLLDWIRSSTGDLAFSSAEYLREETGDLARAGDVEEWLRGVERLREHTDRLEARIKLIEQPS